MGNVNYRTFQDMAICIRNGLKKIPNDWDLIVGIPRSGMIPAYMIGLMLNKPVSSIDEFIYGIQPSNGERKLNTHIKKLQKKRVLIVDDSIHSGVAHNKAKERLNTNNIENYDFNWLAVYAREESKNIVDFYFEILPPPRVFEWNYLNSHLISWSCFDIDGVLCVDPSEEENDDGEKYISFLKNASPLFIPQIKIHTIVTSRLEKYRNQTEEWLNKHHVKYGNLIMLDLPSKEDRIRLQAHASFKAKVYSSLSDTNIFYESDRKQALQIAALTKKACFCVETDEIFYGTENLEFIPHFSADSQNISGLKILLYTHELTYTGAPHSLLRICNILLKKGCHVEVWSPINGLFKREFEKVGVTVRIVENPALQSQKYRQIIAGYDLAIANTVLAHRFYLVAVELIPTVWFIREALNLPAMVDGVPERRKALIEAKKIYCVSEFAQQAINRYYNYNTRVIHNCVEDYYSGESNSSRDCVIFAIVGNMKFNKGFDICVEAFEKLAQEQQKRAKLYLIGRLPENDKPYWETILKIADNNPQISYMGEIVDTQKKIELFRSIDVFIVASRSESCSLVALEAAMLGKPLIVNQNVGAKYIVGQDSGWVIKPDDINELCNIMSRIIQKPEELLIRGINSRKHYLETSTIDIYEKSIVQLVSENVQGFIKPKNKQVESNRALIIKENEISTLHQEILLIRTSLSYRIGRAITYIPRKIRGGIRYWREYGIRSTIKLIFAKLGLKKK